MSQLLRSPGSLLVTLVLLTSCAGPGERASSSAPVGSEPAPARALVMATNVEVETLNAKRSQPTNPQRTTRIFNAGLSIIDPRDGVHPYVAEGLPQLNADSWRVSPDGRMETTWKLRRGLTWHDGYPLEAEDFAFAFNVYSAPNLGVFGPSPQNLMVEVSAPDPSTLLIRWKAPYPDADRLSVSDFGPLPRHLLESAFSAFREDQTARDAFLALSYWTTEYVGSGPYRLTNWERGSYLEGVAFDAHLLGKPKIGRVVVRFISDDNAVFTNMLAESIDFAMGQSLRFEHATLLQREWIATKRGVVIYLPTSIQAAQVQLRAEYTGSLPLGDIRVRRAIAHGIDRAGLNDALFDNKAPIIHSFVLPEQPEFAEIERAVTQYPYDPRRLGALMVEAGFQKDRDGFFASEEGDRFQPTFWVTAGAQLERQLAIMTDTWRQAGIDFQPYVIPAAQARDDELRAKFPGLLNYGAATPPGSIQQFTTDEIATAANRWGGSNRGGWSNPEYDRLQKEYRTTLDGGGRSAALVGMARVLSDQVPVYALFPNLGAITHLATVKGPEASPNHWNIHEWEWTA